MFGWVKNIKRKAKHYILKRLSDMCYFSIAVRNMACRQEFFYNAFKVLSFNGIEGDYVEFGCRGGMTFALAYYEAKRHAYKTKLWAFDSFQGLPAPEGAKDEHPVWKKGDMMTTLHEFHAICNSNKIPRNAYTAVPGFYKQTLIATNTINLPDNISLAYIDCDLYSSTKTVLEFLMPHLKHGMIIAFDDYFCWSRSQIAGERMAALELFSKHPRWELVPYMQFGWHGNSFVVEDKTIINQ